MNTDAPPYRLGRVMVVVAALLMVPLVAMQFSSEVNWSVFDFIVAGTLLAGTGVAYELVARRGSNFAYRAAVGLALGSALFLVWSNLAVGLIGSENNRANLMYLGVLAVGIAGAALARLQPRGMVRTLLAMAVAQGVIGVIALAFRLDPRPLQIVEVNGFFIVLFVASALLFRVAAREQPRAGAASRG
jgi:predicted membrane channel-forming protein YqfA (hemolysin III family)